MIPTLAWPWLLVAGVALVVGLIAFMVASGLTERDHEDAGRGSNGVSRAS